MCERVNVLVSGERISVSGINGNRLHFDCAEAFDFSIEIQFLKMMDEIDGQSEETYSHRGLLIPASQIQDVADEIAEWMKQVQNKRKQQSIVSHAEN